MPGNDEPAGDTSEREILTTRLFEAPRDLVFAAWSRSDVLERWWGPRGFTTTTHAFAFRVGGGWRLTMHGPDGKDYPNRLVFDEVAPPQRIVYSHHGGVDGVPAQFQCTIAFAAEGGQTRVTMRHLFATREARDAVVEKYGAAEGARETLERLGEQVEASRAELGKLTVVMVRTFDAPRDRVFEAWTKAEHVRQWFTPRPLTTPACEVEFRPGGAFHITMRFPDQGGDHAFDGTFGELDPPRSLTFDGTLPDGNVIHTRVTFEERDGRTTVTVVQSYAFSSDSTRGAPEGWTASLDQLGEVVAGLQAR